MSGRRRRTPIGTQPPITSENQPEAARLIDAHTEKVGKLEPRETQPSAADQEAAIIVQIDDDWLERLDLPLD